MTEYQSDTESMRGPEYTRREFLGGSSRGQTQVIPPIALLVGGVVFGSYMVNSHHEDRWNKHIDDSTDEEIYSNLEGLQDEWGDAYPSEWEVNGEVLLDASVDVTGFTLGKQGINVDAKVYELEPDNPEHRKGAVSLAYAARNPVMDALEEGSPPNERLDGVAVHLEDVDKNDDLTAEWPMREFGEDLYSESFPEAQDHLAGEAEYY